MKRVFATIQRSEHAKNDSVYAFNGAVFPTDKRNGRKKRPATFLPYVCETRKSPRSQAQKHSCAFAVLLGSGPVLDLGPPQNNLP